MEDTSIAFAKSVSLRNHLRRKIQSLHYAVSKCSRVCFVIFLRYYSACANKLLEKSRSLRDLESLFLLILTTTKLKYA